MHIFITGVSVQPSVRYWNFIHFNMSLHFPHLPSQSSTFEAHIWGLAMFVDLYSHLLEVCIGSTTYSKIITKKSKCICIGLSITECKMLTLSINITI